MNYCFVHKIWHDTPVCPKDPLKEIKLDEKGEYNVDKDREFHKNLAYAQSLLVIYLSTGLSVFAVGISEILFSYTIKSSYYYLGGIVFFIAGVLLVAFGYLQYFTRMKKL